MLLFPYQSASSRPAGGSLTVKSKLASGLATGCSFFFFSFLKKHDPSLLHNIFQIIHRLHTCGYLIETVFTRLVCCNNSAEGTDVLVFVRIVLWTYLSLLICLLPLPRILIFVIICLVWRLYQTQTSAKWRHALSGTSVATPWRITYSHYLWQLPVCARIYRLITDGCSANYPAPLLAVLFCDGAHGTTTHIAALLPLATLEALVINDGEQTTTSKGIKPQETRDLTWKTPSTREGKTTGASQQQFTMSGVRLQRQLRRLTRREWINLQWKTLTCIYDPYRTGGLPLLPPLRSGASLPATGLRFAPSEVSLSLERQNLDHNSTTHAWCCLRCRWSMSVSTTTPLLASSKTEAWLWQCCFVILLPHIYVKIFWNLNPILHYL
jgi:hypothetical protein